MATKATEDERKFILVYRSISLFTGFVGCQEQELQQKNEKKKMNNTTICFANAERDLRMLKII